MVDYYCSNELPPPPPRYSYNLRSQQVVKDINLKELKRAIASIKPSPTTTKSVNRKLTIRKSERLLDKHEYPSSKRKNKRQGKARLFLQLCNNKTGLLKMVTLYERRFSAQDCCRQDGGVFNIIPNTAINKDNSITCFIDNTNLSGSPPSHELPPSVVKKKKIPGRTYAVVALSTDNKVTWRLAIILNDHPLISLYSFCHWNADQKLVIHDEIHEVNVKELYERPLMSVDEETSNISVNSFDTHYLNRITLESNAADGFVECSICGYDKVHENYVSYRHNKAVKDAIAKEISIVNTSDKKLRLVKTPHQFNLSKPEPRKSLARKNKVTTFVRVEEQPPPDSGVAVILPNESNQSTVELQQDHYTPKTVTTCFVSSETITKCRKLSKQYAVPNEPDEQRLPIQVFIDEVKNSSTSTKQLHISKVNEEGLVLESTNDPHLVNTSEREDDLITPRQRLGKKVAEWYRSTHTKVNMELLVTMIDLSYRRQSCMKRNTTHNHNTNIYIGKVKSYRPLATVRKSTDSIYLSDRWNEHSVINTYFIPRLCRDAIKLTTEANEIMKASDPDFYNFLLKVSDGAIDGHHVRTCNSPAFLFNQLALLTFNFFNTPHPDKNDSFGSLFANHGLNFICGALDSLQQDESREDYVGRTAMAEEALFHLLRLGRQANGSIDFRLPATCGYDVRYPEGSDRNISVHFVYNAIERAVELPINQVSYQIWNTSLYHQTAFPYTYDNEYVYLNDKALRVLGWKVRVSMSYYVNSSVQYHMY